MTTDDITEEAKAQLRAEGAQQERERLANIFDRAEGSSLPIFSDALSYECDCVDEVVSCYMVAAWLRNGGQEPSR